MATKPVTLSIPEDLHDRAKALGIGNWSAILQTALRSAVMIEELKQSGDDVEAGLARLRASRDDNEEALEAEGVGIGKAWALQRAEHAELERIAAISPDLSGIDHGYEYALVSALTDDPEPNLLDAKDALEDIFDRKYPPGALIKGFIAGATEIYEMY